ncbi:MAG: hypothetical protein JXL81_02205 [Deltaproteobacteria bacterium]|nr:hypothetical protein [Deltaproteobacteria bacterium]
MLGGLYKRTAYLNEYRKTHKNLIVVDSGDLLNEHYTIKDSFKSSAKLKAELISKIYKNTGIDAINIGELELVLGIDNLKEIEKKFDIPFVSANIVDSNNKLVFKPYVITKTGDFNVGIIGVMGNSPDMTKLMNDIAGDSLSVLDPVETVKEKIAEIKDKVNFVIVLTHDIMNRNWKIARSVEGVDVIVGGHQKLKLKTPYNPKNNYIVESGEKGQYQGMLEIEIAADGTKTATNSLVPFNDKIADDKDVKEMIAQFNQELAKIYSQGSSSENKDTSTPKSIRCSECHSDAYEVWTKSDHAKAFQTLINKNQQFNPDCLVCHTTLFEQPGGFSVTAQEKELRNIQCESCHGDSAAHLEDPGTVPQGNPGMETCLKCHTEHRCPDFEKKYAGEWEKIKH